MQVTLAVSPTPGVSWRGFLVGQLLRQSGFYSAVRGGTVFEHLLGILPVEESFVLRVVYANICGCRALYVSLRPCASSI